jgi:hypothetical protein
MTLQKKDTKRNSGAFSLRIKIGDYEIELNGTHSDVMATAESLPELIASVNKAFESAKPKTVATITVKAADKTEPVKLPENSPTQKYPKIETTDHADQAVVRILESDWGKWRPRTVEELKEALLANDLKFSERVLTSSLDGLSKKGRVRRWSTNTGFVYILAEQKIKLK